MFTRNQLPDITQRYGFPLGTGPSNARVKINPTASAVEIAKFIKISNTPIKAVYH